MFAFRDGHGDRDLRRLILRKARRDVDELEELEPVQAPLAFGEATQLIQVALVECELSADDIFVDRHIPVNRDGTKYRLGPGIGR